MNRTLMLYLIWAAAACLGILNALQYTEAALLGSEFVPVGNDSFYHARRILDAAFSERGFYQFDPMIHVPEGSWLTWPWAYDYLLSRVLRAAAWVSPGTAPMAILAHVALLWSLVNTGLFVAIGQQLRLSLPMLAIGAAAFAGAQLNQQLHGLGVIDHHYIEQTFTLLALWLGLKVFSAEPKARTAIALGVSLGIATAFHNALFILQLPLLAAMFILWWREKLPPRGIVVRIAAALLIGTLLGLLPSEPFTDLQFSFMIHSWFHLYVAICTAAVLLLMALRPFDKASLAILVAGSVLLSLPIAAQMLSGARFVSGDIGPVLANIAEIKSPVALMLGGWGAAGISSLYSLLIFLVPLVLVYFAWQALSRHEARDVFFAVSAVFCLGLLLLQYRMQYFGSWALVLGPLWILQYVSERLQWRSVLVAVVALVAYVVAYVPVIQNQRNTVFAPANDPDYRYVAPAFAILDRLCREQPGNVLAYNNDGHYLGYHTSCGVMANNFLLTPQHFEKVAEVNRLLMMSPQQFLQSDHPFDYLFVRFANLPNIVEPGPGGIDIESIYRSNPQLVVELNLGSTVPEGLQLIAEVVSEDELGMPYLRVFRVLRSQTQ